MKSVQLIRIRQSGPIADFFRTRYPGFDYDPRKGAVEEWRRLCTEHLYINPDDSEEYRVRESRRSLRTAMVRQFNERFGVDDHSLLAWQALCMKINIAVPDDIAECKKALFRTHVNLVDLTEMEEGDPPPFKFPTVKALSEYSKATLKIFPRDHVEAGSLLKTLLRQINKPPPS
ncbi:hypothetical protein EXIGLDRAFT_769883 [Exidia glandulosa HHB12029]|uniref:Uncharacterized protein n=1 Tax=Exidia glandulosa HHB12029 TaxID=1314781 RepID=A0A165H4H6_EXIGL|nr:hypothetical protein EXIGLDRAFT_769883 [Exidia glandulosa HHB12029]